MSQMQYKTRGGTPPGRKPRVYFLCHPADFEYCFESLSNEILARQNCAIWYSESNAVRDEDFFADLKQMQLFVMPVTTNLLSTANEALDKDFRFAVENHIPVLPLMQESGLEELFNEKCGNLQFLDPNTVDKTAISYEEKLQKYLESVLLSDTDTEKIRAAFDAYIFLSYRKKDRKYAQELMRLIHKNPLLWNVAIWYDEFLVPGENFNDAIRAAIEKSSLFVLAVTPNMVNEPNYVMTTEYPLAQEIGKPVLACELLPTDVEALARYFNGLSHCLDPQNSEAMDRALKTALQVVEKGYADPTHTFFVGLAYLGGVDVEIDTDRAVELITRAAEAGLPEAMDKLITMYTCGQGIPRDYVKAVAWIQKRYEKAKEACPLEATPEQLHALFLATRTCYSDMRALGIQEAGNASLIQVMQRLEQEGGQDPACLRDLSLCYVHMSYAKDKSEGINWCQKALDIRIALDAANRTLQTQRDLASAWNRMGHLNPERENQCYENALALREAVALQSNQMEDVKLWASLCNSLCALSQLQQACDLGKQIATQTCTEADLESAIEIFQKLPRNTQTDKVYLSLDIYEMLAQHYPTTRHLKELSEQYYEIGKQLLSNRKKEQALFYYEKAHNLYLKLSLRPVASVNWIDICLRLAEDKWLSGNNADAYCYAEQAFKMTVAIMECGTFYVALVSKSLSELIVLFGFLQQNEKAQHCRKLKKALPVLEPYPEHLLQAERKATKGREHARKGNYSDAYELYLEAVELLDSVLSQTDDPTTLLTQQRQFDMLAQISAKASMREERYWLHRSLEISKQLVETGTHQDTPCLSGAYWKLGRYYVRSQEYALAESAYAQAITILEELPEKQSWDYQSLAGYHKELQAMYSALEKPDEAKAHQEYYLRHRAEADTRRETEEKAAEKMFGI